MVSDKMTGSELKNTLILAFIFALRMLGLFMMLPVFALYVDKFKGASISLIGLAAGIYGFTQALLQLPWGWLSDKIGRRVVIIMGLSVFVLGSLVAGLASSIGQLIIGRALQGAGAIGAVVLACVADVTREQVRTRAMAIIGMSIGATFVLSLLLGPLLESYVGLKGLFALSAVLALVAMGLAMRLSLPAFPVIKKEKMALLPIWSLNTAIFGLHAIFTSLFLVLPLKIPQMTDWPSTQSWRFYLPILALSLAIVVPLLRYADQSGQKKWMQLFMLSLGLTTLGLIHSQDFKIWVGCGILFFAAFNFLEASLPALVSKIAPTNKGAILGLYSCSQFLGMFFGGVWGGYVLQNVGLWGVSISSLVFSMVGWWALLTKRSQSWQEGLTKSF